MFRYTVRRFFNAIIVFVIASIIAFTVINMAPGDFSSNVLGLTATERDVVTVKTYYGLNQSAPVRYYIWLRTLLKGSLGVSFGFNRPVTQVIKTYLPFTLSIVTISIILALIISILLSIITAVKRKSMLDYILSTFSLIGISIPDFWIPCVILAIFRTKLELLPYIGQAKRMKDLLFIDLIRLGIFPVIFLTLIYTGSCVRYFRSSIQEILSMEYIISARSRGISEGKIIFKHTLRNAMAPVITYCSLTIPSLISTTIVFEALFNCPGLGRIFLFSCFSRDYPMIMGISLITIALIIICSFMADICYMLVDPRVKYE